MGRRKTTQNSPPTQPTTGARTKLKLNANWKFQSCVHQVWGCRDLVCGRRRRFLADSAVLPGVFALGPFRSGTGLTIHQWWPSSKCATNFRAFCSRRTDGIDGTSSVRTRWSMAPRGGPGLVLRPPATYSTRWSMATPTSSVSASVCGTVRSASVRQAEDSLTGSGGARRSIPASAIRASNIQGGSPQAIVSAPEASRKQRGTARGNSGLGGLLSSRLFAPP